MKNNPITEDNYYPILIIMVIILIVILAIIIIKNDKFLKSIKKNINN